MLMSVFFKDIDKFYYCYIVSVFRAAMKMANIDHCFDNMFTNPKDSQGVSDGWYVVQWTFVGSAHTHNPVWSDGEADFSSVESPDKGPGRRAFVFRRRLCRARRLFGVRSVEKALACKGIWHDAERTLWLQTGRFLRSAEWALRTLLWYEQARHVQREGRNCLRQWMTQWKANLCGS